MKKKILKAVLGILICWGIFVAIEGFRLIGSTDPGKCPLITLGSTQTADEIADYGSLGFSQTYHLTNGDAFVYGEFRVWGIRSKENSFSPAPILTVFIGGAVASDN